MIHSIVGCGRVAPNHVLGFQKNNVAVKWCCDINLDTARTFSQKYNIPNYTADYKLILGDEAVSSVSICTDHASHSKLTIDSLYSAKHVLVEKPMAINATQAMAMIVAAGVSKKMLSVVYQNRFSKMIAKIRADIHAGFLGEITAISALVQCSKGESYYRSSNWRGTSEKEGGSTLINQGIHTLDIILWIMRDPIYVAGIKSNIKFKDLIDTEDSLAALLKFKNGAVCTFTSTNASTVPWESSVEFVGTRGRICFTTSYPFMVLKLDLAEGTEPYRAILDNIGKAESDRQSEFPSEIYYGVTHFNQISNFINAIEKNEDLFISGEDGLKTTQIVDAIYREDGLN